MGIQVAYNMKDLIKYNMKDLLKYKEVDLTFESEVYYNSDDEPVRLWSAFSPTGCYMGQSMTDDIYGTYWFDNKDINFDSVDILIQYQVPYSRG